MRVLTCTEISETCNMRCRPTTVLHWASSCNLLRALQTRAKQTKSQWISTNGLVGLQLTETCCLPGLIPGLVIWDFWLTNCHWEVFSKYFGFPCRFSFRQILDIYHVIINFFFFFHVRSKQAYVMADVPSWLRSPRPTNKEKSESCYAWSEPTLVDSELSETRHKCCELVAARFWDIQQRLSFSTVCQTGGNTVIVSLWGKIIYAQCNNTLIGIFLRQFYRNTIYS